MPPRIPVRYPWASRPAISHPTSRRTLTSTTPTLALGPQSPNYIDVPKPLQPTFPLEPKPKGHLPVPRDIFKTRNPRPKESIAFLKPASTSPKDVKAPGPHSRDAEYRLYKQRLSDIRRSSLREGVKELHDRKVSNEAAHFAKIQANYADKTKRAMAPPRETDVLTATSIQPAIRDFLAAKQPLRTLRTPRMLARRRRGYQAKQDKLMAVRTSRLHDLYINARTFIVEEAQLDEAIDATFGTEEDPMGWNNKGDMGLRSMGNEGLSPWHGTMPEGVGDMLEKLRGGEGVGLAKERVKKVAEALTGGKM